MSFFIVDKHNQSDEYAKYFPKFDASFESERFLALRKKDDFDVIGRGHTESEAISDLEVQIRKE